MLNIEVSNENQVMAYLKPERFRKAVKAGLKAIALHVKGAFAEYPPDTNAHRPQPFKTDRQRRFFFAALRAGEIEVPYRRGQSPTSERFGHRWTIASRRDGMVQIVGNNTSYGPLLKADDRQSAYHRVTGWKTIDDDTRTEEKTANETLNDYLFRELEA